MAQFWIIQILIAVCLVGDGESETATAATAWHLNKFIDPAKNGAVLADTSFEWIQNFRSDYFWQNEKCRFESLVQRIWI